MGKGANNVVQNKWVLLAGECHFACCLIMILITNARGCCRHRFVSFNV